MSFLGQNFIRNIYVAHFSFYYFYTCTTIGKQNGIGKIGDIFQSVSIFLSIPYENNMHANKNGDFF